MIIIKVSGGLGNQMYQYAFYRALLSRDFKVKLDISTFETYKVHNGFELESVFTLPDLNFASKRDVTKCSDQSANVFARARRKFLGLKNSHVKEAFYSEDLLKEKLDIYLEGHWQSDLYFSEVDDEIIEDFKFSKPLSSINEVTKEKMKSTNSVSIHIRRGDYITNPDVYNAYGKVCSIDYYQSAIELIRKKIRSPYFFVFSNDIEWVKENINFSAPVDYVNWNLGKESFVDIQMMSLCKNNIIANSSFSWWGAWLNKNPEKIVVAPARWMVKPDINNKRVPDDWNKIDIQINESE